MDGRFKRILLVLGAVFALPIRRGREGKGRQAMRQTTHRSAGALTRGARFGTGSGVPPIGVLLRRRWRKAVAAKDTKDASSRKIAPDHGPDAARFPMEAGITGGVSLLFGGFDARGPGERRQSG